MKTKSYEHIKDGGKNLIVSFASNGIKAHRPVKFEFVKSLSNMLIDSDFLFMKDFKRHWYLGGLGGIGVEFNDTLSFLRNVIADYDKVIFLGVSAGGYASILFGSLLGIDSVVSFAPQTDLDFAKKHAEKSIRPNLRFLFDDEFNKLRERKMYNNLREYINPTTKYYLYTDCQSKCPLHHQHHFDNIKKSVKKLYSINKDAPEFVGSGELEVLLKELLGRNSTKFSR